MAENERLSDPPHLAGAARSVLHAVMALAGWALFVYWWGLVFRRVGEREIRTTLLFIAIALVVIVGVTAWWALHNLRIFHKRGSRRSQPHAATPDLTRDHVGREVRLPALPDACRLAPVVRVCIQDGAKVYAPESPVPPPPGIEEAKR